MNCHDCGEAIGLKTECATCPIFHASRRVEPWPDPKVVVEATPTRKGRSKIEEAVKASHPDLLPCPFCGGKAKMKECPVGGTASSGMEPPDWRVVCTVCGTKQPKHQGSGWRDGEWVPNLGEQAQRDAASLWNRRA